MSVDAVEASRSRNIDLAVRAARIWHASIVARALELNEKGEHRRAESFVNRARRDFTVYVAGLPNVADLIDSLHQLAHRVGSAQPVVWFNRGRRSAAAFYRDLAQRHRHCSCRRHALAVRDAVSLSPS